MVGAQCGGSLCGRFTVWWLHSVVGVQCGGYAMVGNEKR